MTLIMVEYILAFIVAAVTQNISEWFAHKYVLHKMGAKKSSFFHYHWEHHARCRQNENNIDQEYVDLFENGKVSNMIKKEIFLVLGSHVLIALPTFLFLWEPLGIAYVAMAWYYYISHALSHSNTRFEFLMPWHYDHHMGKDQNLNWCVTFPWFDWFTKTRTSK